MKLWGAIWNCEDSIKKNGRNGQKQQGIDIWGQKPSELLDSGIQCKLKSNNKNLSIQELDKEIGYAQYYKDSLQRLIIATTANKDTKIEEYVRTINRKHKECGLFEVYLFLLIASILLFTIFTDNICAFHGCAVECLIKYLI